MVRRLVASGLLLAGLLASPSAFSDEPAKEPPKAREPTAGDLASARNALREGLALRDKGDVPGALARLQSAWDFVPTPVTGFELGKTHLMLGHVLQAHELFAKVGRIPPSLEESSRSQSARDEAARLVKEVAPRIPSLRLKLVLPPSASAVVKIDDERVPFSGAETTRLVEVGAHDVTAKAGDGPEQSVHIDVVEAEVKDVELTPQWIPPKEKPAGATGAPVIYVRQTNPLTFIGFGIAGAGIVITTISAVVFLNGLSDAAEHCGKSYCPPANTFGLPSTAVYDPEFDNARARYQIAGVVMAASALTTLVFGGIGAVFAARPIKEKVTAHSAPSLAPVVGLGRAGLEGTF